MTIEVVNPKNGLPYLTRLPDVPNVPPAWQAEMARLLASMNDDEDIIVENTFTPTPPVSQVRQCQPQQSTNGERRSLLQSGNETATSTTKVG
ncbi:MAG: hypothetical protein R3B71_00590 [Candidatus Gracilibacteria bacterium]